MVQKMQVVYKNGGGFSSYITDGSNTLYDNDNRVVSIKSIM
jgi:hypothetical protein